MEICRDSNVCGGCVYQGVPYEEQLSNKAGEVRGLIEKKISGTVNFSTSSQRLTDTDTGTRWSTLSAIWKKAVL